MTVGFVTAEMSVAEMQRQLIPDKSKLVTAAGNEVKAVPGGLIVELGAELAAANDILAILNPYGRDVLIERVILNIGTAGGTATAVIDVDITTGPTGTGDDILDGVDANAAAVSDSLNATDNGTNGEGKAQLWNKEGGTNPYVTAKLLVEAAASLVGHLYIQTAPATI